LQQWTRPKSEEGSTALAEQRSDVGSDAGARFVPSTLFSGARPGFVFKKGAAGMGYYRCFLCPLSWAQTMIL
jgi:hypothetical protein